MLGTKGLISNIDVEVKRRKILALTPPPDVFLSNSNQFNDHNKGLDFPSTPFCKDDMTSSISSSSTLELTGCGSSHGSTNKMGDDFGNCNDDNKKQIECDMEFFRIISEDTKDPYDNSDMANIFGTSRSFESAQHQDSNMNNVTKEIAQNMATKYDLEANNVTRSRNFALHDISISRTKVGPSHNRPTHIPSSISNTSKDKLHREPPPNKTVFNCPAPNPPIPNLPFKPPQKLSNTNNTFSNFIKSNTSVNLGSKKTILCDMCHETFEHEYLLWIHKRIHIPKESRLLCSFCPFITSNSHGHHGTGDNGISLLKSHINKTHFRGIQCRVCRVFVAESRAEMSRHVYRAHMYDKKFYTKQFNVNLFPNQATKTQPIFSRQKSYSRALVKGQNKTQIGSRLCQHPQQNIQSSLQQQQSVYCIL